MDSLIINTKINKNINIPKNIININDTDYILAKKLNMIDTPDDFYNMIEIEEEFLDDYYSFLDELYLSENDSFRKKEVLYLNETYYDIPVRIKKIYKNYAFGEISHMNYVYIPKKFVNNLSFNELVSMNIIYKNNNWKCININQKVKPVLINQLEIEKKYTNYTKELYHIPYQENLGFILGKNGNNLKKIFKNYFKNNPQNIKFFGPDIKNFDEWYNYANLPSFNFENNNLNYTEVTISHEINYDYIKKMNFDYINDILMKLYY